MATDRPGGGPRLLLNIPYAVQKSGTGFKKSLDEPHIDTTASLEMAEMAFFWVGWAARWEWQRIRSRTQPARVAVMTRGVKMGRKPKLTPHQRREALDRKAGGEESISDIALSYGVNHTMISRLRPMGDGSLLEA